MPDERFDASAYGEHIAAMYDALHTHLEPAPAVEALAELAGGGRALELGIGTGRIALPLAARGVEMHGIDASPAMVERLRAKPGGAAIEVAIGDFADIAVEGAFDLVFVAFNTFFALLTQDEQVRCFANVAERLAPGGAFVIEAFVPDLNRYERRQRALAVARIDGDRTVLDAATHDPVAQRVTTRLLVIEDERVQTYPIEIRYAWPSELDLMARLAGLRLRERWAGWSREPFTAASTSHVSVYEQG
jgi:SAM-dependent methyltransferase